MLLVVGPFALVLRSIRMLVLSLAMGFIQLPLTFVDVAIHVFETPKAVCFVVLPLAFVSGPVRPHLFSFTMPDASYPFSGIRGAILEPMRPSLLSVALLIQGALNSIAINSSTEVAPNSMLVPHGGSGAKNTTLC